MISRILKGQNFIHTQEKFFHNKVLFMAGECQQVIGVDWQRRQMSFFPSAGLAVIPAAGHEMFAENPGASIAALREYLNAPAR